MRNCKTANMINFINRLHISNLLVSVQNIPSLPKNAFSLGYRGYVIKQFIDDVYILMQKMHYSSASFLIYQSSSCAIHVTMHPDC